jgi:ParB family transcriptional regulator, chromosome partitioning protein
MSRRGDRIQELFTSTANSEKLAMANSPPVRKDAPADSVRSGVPSPERATERVPAGPVRSMALALDGIKQESRILQETLAAGATIIELDPELVDASFIRDRLSEPEAEFERFKRSIAENGQEVPILVRPHPSKDRRYEIAFGHRRRRACAQLGRKVRAVVREMSDRELVIAQGLENSERRDLSYIERGLYAARLEDRGFERTVICEALATDKGELSKLVLVARAVPEAVIEAIGPAPKAGRRRWLALAEALQDSRAKRATEIAAKDPDLAKADTDTRFLRILASVTPRRKGRPKVSSWKSSTGRASATVTRTDKSLSVAFDRSTEPEFAEFVASRLDELYSTFLSQAKAGD